METVGKQKVCNSNLTKHQNFVGKGETLTKSKAFADDKSNLAKMIIFL